MYIFSWNITLKVNFAFSREHLFAKIYSRPLSKVQVPIPDRPIDCISGTSYISQLAANKTRGEGQTGGFDGEHQLEGNDRRNETKYTQIQIRILSDAGNSVDLNVSNLNPRC